MKRVPGRGATGSVPAECSWVIPLVVLSVIVPLLLSAAVAKPGLLQPGERDLSLEVTVKDEFGAPIWRAEIILEGFRAWEGRPVYTQAEGVAVFTGLAKGGYRMRVSAPRCTPVVYEDHLIGSDNIGIVLRRVSETQQGSPVSTVSLPDLAAPPKAQAEYRKGLVHLEKGRYDKARRTFQGALKEHPSYSAAYAGLGISLLNLGKREDALQAFQQALQLNEHCYDAQVSIGLILNDRKRYHEAYRYLSAAAESRREHPWQLHYQLGRTYYGLDQLADAERSLLKARQALPPYGNLYLLLANTFSLQQKYEQAIPELEKFLEVAPESRAATEVRTKLSMLRAEVDRQEKSRRNRGHCARVAFQEKAAHAAEGREAFCSGASP